MSAPSHTTGSAFLSWRKAAVLGALFAIVAIGAIVAAPDPTTALLFLAGAVIVIGAVASRALYGQIREREAYLQHSAQRYRTLFQRNVAGVVLADEEDRCLEANEAFARMLGFDEPSEVRGRAVPTLLELPDRQSEDFPRPQVVYEVHATRRDGEAIAVLACWGPVEYEGSEKDRMLMSIVDITEEHLNRERLIAVMNAVEEAIVTVGQDGHIAFANAAARRLMGVGPEEVRELTLRDPPWSISTLDGESVTPEACPAMRAMREGRPLRDEMIRVHLRHGPSPILRVHAMPLGEVEGEVEEVVVSMRDETDRVEAARALERSEKQHRTVVDHVGQVIFQTDPRGRLTFLNHAWTEMTGHDVEDSLGSDVIDYVHPDDRRRCRDEIEAVIEGRQYYCRHETRIVTADGSPRWVEVRARPAARDEGPPRGVAGLLTDITERREMEERMARARRMEAMGQLAGGVAHDFNNLLTVIVGYAQLMQSEAEETPGLPESLRVGAREIFRTSQKAAGLTRQLLTFSRQQVLDRAVLDVNDVIRRYEHFMGRFLPETIRCNLELEPALHRVEMSPTHLEQALLNLVINARDALEGEPFGRLTVRTRNVTLADDAGSSALGLPPGEYVAVEVQDTGCGMDGEVLQRIFEPFFTTKGKERGTGMGLASVYGIVTQARGAIDVQSEPGVGSTFTVYLPAARPDR